MEKNEVNILNGSSVLKGACCYIDSPKIFPSFPIALNIENEIIKFQCYFNLFLFSISIPISIEAKNLQ